MSAQEREWQPGDKALIEVEVLGVDRGFAAVDAHDGPGYRTCITVVAARLRPVSGVGVVEAATDDVIELAGEIITTIGWPSPDEFVSEWGERVARTLSRAGLLVGGVPDRSEAETCGLCRKPATGLASINDTRYCHGDEDRAPTCYEVAVMRGTGVPSRAGLSIPREPFPVGRSEAEGGEPS